MHYLLFFMTILLNEFAIKASFLSFKPLFSNIVYRRLYHHFAKPKKRRCDISCLVILSTESKLTINYLKKSYRDDCFILLDFIFFINAFSKMLLTMPNSSSS